MKLVRVAILTTLLLALTLGAALAAPESPETIASFSITPTGAYPGQTAAFLVDWSTTVSTAAGDGQALCIYYAQNYNQTAAVSDGFVGAAASALSLNYGDTYTKVGPGALGAGVGPGAGASQMCNAFAGRYAVGYYIAASDNGGLGVSGPDDALQVDVVLPRGAADETFTVRQRRDPTGAGGTDVWAPNGFGTRAYDMNPAASAVFAGSPAQCGASAPCYATLQEAVNYVADGGAVNVMGALTEAVNINRDMTLQSGASGASLSAPAGDAITVGGGNVVVRNLTVTSSAAGSALNVTGGAVVVKGSTFSGAGAASTVFSISGGSLSAYANNVNPAGGAAFASTGGAADLGQNWWGSFSTQPGGLPTGDWDLRLGALVVTWADGTNSASLNGAALTGGSGTAVIVGHDRSNPPFNNGITPFVNSMCGEYYNFFVRNGSGTWTVGLPVDNSLACNTNVRDTGLSYKITDITECTPATNPSCWDKIITGVSVNGQTIFAAGFSTAALNGMEFVVGSNTGSDPTVVTLRSLSATSSEFTAGLLAAVILAAAAMLVLGVILRRRFARI
jgi:hypothetical protein